MVRILWTLFNWVGLIWHTQHWVHCMILLLIWHFYSMMTSFGTLSVIVCFMCRKVYSMACAIVSLYISMMFVHFIWLHVLIWIEELRSINLIKLVVLSSFSEESLKIIFSHFLFFKFLAALWINCLVIHCICCIQISLFYLYEQFKVYKWKDACHFSNLKLWIKFYFRIYFVCGLLMLLKLVNWDHFGTCILQQITSKMFLNLYRLSLYIIFILQ